MRSIAAALALACVVIAAPRTNHPASILDSLPVRFEPGLDKNAFRAYGLNYGLAVTPATCAIQVPEASGAVRTITLAVEGANPQATATPTGELTVRTSRYIGKTASNWRHSVPSYRRVTYTDVLPGVDVAYYGSGGMLEFDVVVHPGASPDSIRLRYSGQDRLSVDEQGNLIVHTGDLQVVQKAPVIYQRAGESLRLVSGEYELHDKGLIKYRIGEYDRTQPLVIDPVIVFSANLGGSRGDTATAMVRDSAGHLYIAGTTSSTDLSVTESGAQAASGGNRDLFVMKIDPNAAAESAILYATYFGGTGSDEVRAIALDGDGRLHITGVTRSTDFPVTQYSHQTVSGGDADAFLVTFNTSEWGSSSLVYSSYLGGTGADTGLAIAATRSGRVVVAGWTASTDFPMRGASFQAESAGGHDAFIADFDVFGTLSYSTYMGGDRTDSARAVAFSNDGVILVAGATLSWGFPLAGDSARNSYFLGGDAFLAKIDVSRGNSALVYSTFIGGTGLDEATALIRGTGDRVIVAGYTLSTDFPVTSAAVQSGNRGSTDIFVSAIDLSLPASQAVYYSTLLGGSGADVPYGIALDPAGQVLLTGYTNSADFPATADAPQPGYAGLYDAFVSKLSLVAAARDGLRYSTFVGGSGVDTGYAVEADSNGRVYLPGATASRIFPQNEGRERPGTAGIEDGFVLAIQACEVTLAPLSAAVSAAGGPQNILVSAPNNCSWSARSSADWVVIEAGQEGTGNGTIRYLVSANAAPESRQATITVAGRRHEVNQAATQ